MPLSKYRCDYCEKSFNDTPESRAKHFASTRHLLQVKLHYDSFAKENQDRRPPCEHFHRTGICRLGNLCKYSHIIQYPSQPDLTLDNQSFSIVEQDSTDNIYSLLLSHPNLPPSLLPPAEGYDWTNCAEWG